MHLDDGSRSHFSSGMRGENSRTRRRDGHLRNSPARIDSDGTTLLRGDLTDEAALHGILMKVRDLAVPLLAVKRAETNELER